MGSNHSSYQRKRFVDQPPVDQYGHEMGPDGPNNMGGKAANYGATMPPNGGDRVMYVREDRRNNRAADAAAGAGAATLCCCCLPCLLD